MSLPSSAGVRRPLRGYVSTQLVRVRCRILPPQLSPNCSGRTRSTSVCAIRPPACERHLPHSRAQTFPNGGARLVGEPMTHQRHPEQFWFASSVVDSAFASSGIYTRLGEASTESCAVSAHPTRWPTALQRRRRGPPRRGSRPARPARCVRWEASRRAPGRRTHGRHGAPDRAADRRCARAPRR